MNRQIIIGAAIVLIILLVGIYAANHKNAITPQTTTQTQNELQATSSYAVANATDTTQTAAQSETTTVSQAPAPAQTTPKPVTTKTQPSPSNTATAQAYSNKVILGDVKSGSFINVQEAILSAPGYIVLFRVNSKGQTDMIGHSALLSRGIHINTQIQINTVVAYQQQVVALLVKDNGYGTFQFPVASTYLATTAGDIASDISVVGVARVSNESKALGVSLETYFKNLVTQSSSSTAR